MLGDNGGNRAGTEQRSTKLIADFRNGYVEGWTMLVSEAFREALDIKMTSRTSGGTKEQVWTQGSRYNFKANDLLYSACPDVYTKQWSDGVKSVNFAVEVLAASPASSGVNGTKRSPGFVRINILLPVVSILDELITIQKNDFLSFQKRMEFIAFRPGLQVWNPTFPEETNGYKGIKLTHNEIIDTTQDEFVRFLKTGFMCHATDGIPENVHEYFVREKLRRENNH